MAEISPERIAAFDIVAKSEPSAMGYMAMATETGQTSIDGLGKHLIDRFDLDVTPAGVGRCAQTFARYGFAEVTLTETPRGTHRHFTAANRDIAIPAIGTTLDWSAESDLSLSSALSISNSSGKSRGPSNSIFILEGLLDGGKTQEVATDRYSGLSSQNSRLRNLAEAGIVERDEPRFKIIDPTYRGIRPFGELKPTSQHIYRTLRFAAESEPDREWTVSELFELSAELLPESDQDNENLCKDLRASIGSVASIKRPRDFKGCVAKVDLNRGGYKVTDSYRETVAELVEKALLFFEGNPRILKDAEERAHEIYDDIETSRRLILKGLSKTAGRRYK